MVDNEVYGDRLLRIARANGITAHTVRPDGGDLTRWTTPVDPEAVRAALAEHPGVDAVAAPRRALRTAHFAPERR
ncbi:hypothetical protein [Actinomadura oligospora]|uniref:hypothetical protein n=1 Tax=Actinomadura oligospora TaxID=111804 RepID=UPI000478F1F7|nr:hypothetical protein [Actinomadura oligospora]